MSSSSQPPLSNDKLTFFGAITASLSHELKNVLATIGEFSGLLDDLVAVANTGKPLSPERLQRICGRIAAQIERGEGLVRNLNKFAHTVDEAWAPVDLSQLIVDITTLSRRFATLKQVKLETVLPDTPTVVTTDSFSCQHAIFLCLDMALRVATDTRSITVSLTGADGAATIEIASADPLARSSAPDAEVRLLETLVAQIRSKVEWIAEPGRDRIALTLAGG